MQYFTIQAKSHREAITRMKTEYGENAKILTYRNIRIGGFLGFFGKEGVEVTGYVGGGEQPKHSLEDNKIKILEAAKKEQTLNYILREIKELKQNVHLPQSVGGGAMHPSLEKLRALLEENDFSTAYTAELIERAGKAFTFSELDQFQRVSDTVVDWIADDIPSVPAAVNVRTPRIFTVVGPTGVGKTTTIAKLAALYGIESDRRPAQKVRIVTIDSYRIGAKKQIEIYGEIMRIPVSAAETKDDLKKLIALYSDADLILIDTIGKSHRDFKRLAEMQELLDGVGAGQEVHLAVSASTKTRDLEEIFKQFEPFGYTQVIVTKLDETYQIGNILSVVKDKRKPVSFITDGQKVPQDIAEATPLRLLLQLEGFRINRELLEKRFTEKVKALA